MSSNVATLNRWGTKTTEVVDIRNEPKLVVVIMGPGNKHFVEMAYNSVKDADKILYYTDHVKEVNKIINVGAANNFWDDNDKATNGKARNIYLKHLKDFYPNDWCLAIDEDEIVEDLSKIKEFIKDALQSVYSVKMRHFIGDLGHEDATNQIHVVPHRLFKISDVEKYPEHSHPVLKPKEGKEVGMCLETTIWHLGHLPMEYMKYISKRYKQHADDSLIHNQDFLTQWRNVHLFGQYPTRQVSPREIPKLLYEALNLDHEEMYSMQESIEIKHHIMVKQWYDFFKPASVLDLGCGRGAYLYYWQWFVSRAFGHDINKWAITNSFAPGKVFGLQCYDIDSGYDLITAIDLLEHLNDEDLDKTLKAMYEKGNKFLFSIPFIGDPNLEADNTHIQKMTKEEWIEELTKYGFNVRDPPSHWMFKEQILVATK